MNNIIVDLVLVVLVVLSVVTWTITAGKIRAFKRLLAVNAKFQAEFWNCKTWLDARQVTESSDCEMASVARVGFKEFDAYVSKNPSMKYLGELPDILDRPLRQHIQQILRTNESGLAILASVGSTSPFVGLFGTVWGIMGALKEISKSGQASIDIIAGPIGEALIATAVGIAVALPAVVFYNFFLRKLKIWTTDLDSFMEAYIRLAQEQLKG